MIDTIPDFEPIATEEFIARLLESERLIPSHLLKTRRSDTFLMMLEEQLVGFLNSLTNVLNGLRTYLLPEGYTLSQLGDMRLKFRTVQVLAKHPVVPFVKCNAMVINHPSGIDRPLEMLIPVALI